VRVNCLRQVLGSAKSAECTGEYSSMFPKGLSPNSALNASTGSCCAEMVNKGSPQGEDHEADHLLRVQVVAWNQSHYWVAPRDGLKRLIAAVQATDHFSQ
jgi:hypothetical protein